jgi:hypothetical protein
MGDRPSCPVHDDLQNLPEDPVIRPMLIVHGVPRHPWPDGFISEAQARTLIEDPVERTGGHGGPDGIPTRSRRR